MVPPIQVNVDNPIKRVGAQKTYLFYRNGMETFVVRPGFSGKADNFGMLIPFPNVPSIRKVPNNIFPHIAAAVDPPEVTVEVQNQQGESFLGGAFQARSGSGSGKKGPGDTGLAYDEVRVRKKEAVGMYQTVVLEAGSSEALKNWMDEHEYRYPNNMGRAAQEYVEAGWCFVAVKARVSSKSAVNPKPGMRNANPGLPGEATFDGNVQAMGFRFRSRRLVAPMRLSAYNKGKLHNITYVFADDPVRIRHIPRKYVRRQVSGPELYRNVTEPLPLRVINGKWSDLTTSQQKNVKQQRDPTSENGLAKRLFASDLLAAEKNRLVHQYEREKKELLRIQEALLLRGKHISELNRQVLNRKSKEQRKQALKNLKEMTLTVVDGNFPRKVLRQENLTFAPFQIPARRNRPTVYDARKKGPRKAKEKGNVYQDEKSISRQGLFDGGAGAFIALLLLAGLHVVLRHPRHGTSSFLYLFPRDGGGAGTVLTAVLCAAMAMGVRAEIDVEKQIDKLSDIESSKQAVQQLVNQDQKALPRLVKLVQNNENKLRVRGWGIVALSRIDGEKATKTLYKLKKDGSHSRMIRTLAAAALVRRSDSMDDLEPKLDWAEEFPSLLRPIRLTLKRLNKGNRFRVDTHLVRLASRNRTLRNLLDETIVGFGAKRLAKVLLDARGISVRRTAAAFLGSIARQNGAGSVISSLMERLKFRTGAENVPWEGGPLFLPGVQWQKVKKKAGKLVHTLIEWKVWVAERNDLDKKKIDGQINNSLFNAGLRQAVGHPRMRLSAVEWLRVWRRLAGPLAVRKILLKQGLTNKKPYSKLVR